ncbi:hypothetical protein HK099_000141 [Clydaea vesicula]|uniref:PH domain-containing protein n=1 Tax=Clydaea vesicula TaxID=447962 RepID=A0AAD5TVE6_9FUNG|nr:hypothetical protein HK099_000141 [Clydaea vesicula]
MRKIPLQNSSNASFLSTSISPNYITPKDGYLSSILDLPNAVGGWVAKVSYSLFNKRSLKRKYLVLANYTLYVFSSDDLKKKFEDSYPITSKTSCKVVDKGNYVFEFKTEYSVDHFQEAHMYSPMIMETVVTKKRVEYQCKDIRELQIWLEYIKETISEVKALSFGMESQNYLQSINSGGTSEVGTPSPHKVLSSSLDQRFKNKRETSKSSDSGCRLIDSPPISPPSSLQTTLVNQSSYAASYFGS